MEIKMNDIPEEKWNEIMDCSENLADALEALEEISEVTDLPEFFFPVLIF